MYVYVLDLFLALRSWVDVDPSKETQDQYSEQYEEGKYNMNNIYHFKYIFILHFITVCQ